MKDWVENNILSILGILGGLWAYFRHDKKLKEQEARLNEMQIRQMQKAEAKEQQAEIRCKAYKRHANAFVKIVNAGPSDASNVRIEILNQDKLQGLIFEHKKWGPYDLINASSSIEERIALCCGFTEVLTLKINWDDAYSKDRETILNVQIA